MDAIASRRRLSSSRPGGGWGAAAAWLLGAALWLAGCAPLPPSPADLQAKRFEPVAGKSVIYIVRDEPDFSDRAAPLWLDDNANITTYPGTYYRWEVAPGPHAISGFGPDNGSIRLNVRAGEMYFVLQRYYQGFFPSPQSRFELLPPAAGRHVVMRSQLIGQ